MGKRYYDLSKLSSEQIAQIISASVPKDWCWLDGVLYADAETIRRKKAHADAGFVLGGFIEQGVKVASLEEFRSGRQMGQEARQVDIHGLVTGRRLPAFVAFNEAGYREQFALPLGDVARIAADLVRQDYRGSLRFFRDFVGNKKFSNTARARLELQPWREDYDLGLVSPPRQLPPMLVLSWFDQLGGSSESVRQFTVSCEELGVPCLGDSPDGWTAQTTTEATA